MLEVHFFLLKTIFFQVFSYAKPAGVNWNQTTCRDKVLRTFKRETTYSSVLVRVGCNISADICATLQITLIE